LKAYNSHALVKLVPDEARRLLLDQWARRIEVVRGPRLCTRLANTLELSYAQWDWLRQILCRYMHEDGSIGDMYVDEVKVPMLPGMYSVPY
jgi:hypothetical protein